MIKPVGIATLKANQERYFIYNVASETAEKLYALWVDCAGRVVSCSCPDHKFRKRFCKHMRDLQMQLSANQEKVSRRTTMRQCETWGGDDGQALYGPVLPLPYRPIADAAERKAVFERVAAQVRAIEAGAKTVACKRAKQFVDLPLSNIGFPQAGEPENQFTGQGTEFTSRAFDCEMARWYAAETLPLNGNVGFNLLKPAN